jgi:anti-sigma28 factor (negative regulator of flagellin synthesis)
MQTQIVARVAEYLRTPDARKGAKESAEVQIPVDQVVLSSEGKRKYQEVSNTQSDWEKNRMERVDHVRERIQSNSYRMAPEVVDQIAQRIVALL